MKKGAINFIAVQTYRRRPRFRWAIDRWQPEAALPITGVIGKAITQLAS